MNPTIEPFSVQDILNQVYVNVDDDPTSATTEDTEWTARVFLINSAIGAWERQDVYWRELWTLAQAGVISNTMTYPVEVSNFRQPGSLIYLTNSNGGITYIDVIPPDRAITYTNRQTNGISGTGTSRGQAAFFTGNQSTGWTLNLTWLPTPGDSTYGSNISFYYYKSANRVSKATDVIEMSDPSFAVWYVTAQKQLFYNRTDMASDALAQSQEAMYNMRIKNELMVNYGDNEIVDVDLFRTNASLGE